MGFLTNDLMSGFRRTSLNRNRSILNSGSNEFSFFPTLPPTSISPTPNQAPAVANYPATVQLMNPGSKMRWVMGGIAWSYSATPTGGMLSWSWAYSGVTYVETYTITAGGYGQLIFPTPKIFPVGAEVTIMLAPGGGAVLGTLYPFAATQ